MQTLRIKNIAKITIFVSVIFSLAVSIWYSPILFKGYILSGTGESIILGRNLAQTGIYGAENNLNVLLSPNLVKAEAQISASGNKLTVRLYAEIFKIWGELNENELILLSIAIHALALIIFTLIVLYLFGFKSSLIFSLIYILLPFNWQYSLSPGAYEFALLFFSLFFLFYLFGLSRKYNWAYLIPAGFFLALACLARETFLLFIPFLFVYLWWKSPKRCLLYILIPFMILFSYFWLPDFLGAEGKGNTYLLLFTTDAPEELKSANSGLYHHFPDPYTYHFNKEGFLKNAQSELDNPEISFFIKAGSIKSAANNGFKAPGFLERIWVGSVLFFSHLSRLFSLEEMGGPFIFLLMLLGIYNLKKKNRYFFGLALGWIISVVFLLSFVILAGRQHLMDFNWILALFIALGLIMLAEIINRYFNFNKRKSTILLLVVVSSALYGLVVADHVTWNRFFDSNQESSLRIRIYSQRIGEFNIQDRDVIATPQSVNRHSLNYLNNKSLVLFREETIRDLLNNGELASAFEKFGVRYILGYPPTLTEEIIKQAQVVNIADNAVELPKIKTSPVKMWLMNIVK